jgi:hypothetical protein
LLFQRKAVIKSYADVNYRSGESNFWRGIDLRQLRMTWKEASVAKSEVLLQHLHMGPEKNHASMDEDNMSRAFT